MVQLMLQQLRHRSLEVHYHDLTLHVCVAQGRAKGAIDPYEEIGKREAVVPDMEILGTHVSNLGVDHRRAELADLHEDDPDRRADLRRGEWAAHVVLLAGATERIPEVVRKQPHRRRLGDFNRGAEATPDRVTDLAKP